MTTAGLRVGRYEVGERLGKGGFGVVHLARDHELGREVAIKFLRPEYMTRTMVVQRFLQEARACAKIGHPGIVTVFECGLVEANSRIDGTAYIVMERLRGESLGDRIARGGKLQSLAAIGIARQLAAALYVAHEAGIIHRDLKPDNVFLVKDAAVVGGERVKILDFGVAKLRDPDPDENPNTHSQMMLGTPRYMSPEQARAAAKVDHRTDIYALGCLLYELVCGKPPFGGDIGDVLVAHQTQPITPPRELVPSIPAALDELIVRLLAKEPGARPQSMKLVDEALDQVFGSLAPKKRAKTNAEDEKTTPRKPIGPTTDEPTFRLKPSHEEDTAHDLEDDFHTTKPSRLAIVANQAQYETTLPTRQKQTSTYLRIAIGVAAAVVSGLIMFLVLRKSPQREQAVAKPVVTPDAGTPDAAAVAPDASDGNAIATRCAAIVVERNWTKLADCGRELEKVSPTEGAELVKRAVDEAKHEVKFRVLSDALKGADPDLKSATEALAAIAETSVYRKQAVTAFNTARGPILDAQVAELNALRDCKRHAQKLQSIERSYGTKLAQEARLTARPCATARPPDDDDRPTGLVTPLEACDRETIDTEEQRGDNALANGSFAAALVAFEHVAKCRPAAASKAYLAACRARAFPKAKRYFAQLKRDQLAQICIKEGFDPR